MTKLNPSSPDRDGRVNRPYAYDKLSSWAKRTPGANLERALDRLSDFLRAYTSPLAKSPDDQLLGASEWDPLIDQVIGEMETELARAASSKHGGPDARSLEVRRSRDLAWKELLAQAKHHFDIDDPYILEFVFSSLATIGMPGDPVWAFIVGPPSGLKTEVLRWLSELPRVYTTSRLTPHSLVSGLKDGRHLLPELDGKALVIKDFTTILEMDRKAREEIFAQFRDAFDGYYEGFFGTVGKVAFTSHFHVLAAVTSAIEEYYSVQSFLGPRFLKIRVPALDGFERSIEEGGREEETRAVFSELAARLIRSIDLDEWRSVGFSRVRELRPIAEFLAQARAHVSRFEGAISQPPEPEMLPRLTKQLRKLAVGRAILYGRTEVDDSDLAFVHRIAVDTVPLVRLSILKALDVPLTINEVSRKVALPERTVYYRIEDLEALRLVRGDGGRPERYVLTKTGTRAIAPHFSCEREPPPDPGSAKEVGGDPGSDLDPGDLFGDRPTRADRAKGRGKEGGP